MVELHRQNYKENKKIYKSIEKILREKLPSYVPIDHVGSTAIKNMYGKNIIDVLVGAKNEDEMEAFTTIIKELGFYPGSHSTGFVYRFFASSKQETKSGDVHIHLVNIETDRYKDFLTLRNYLLENKEEVKAYSKLKKEIVKDDNTKREDYKKIKAKYVENLIIKAREYYKI